VPHRAHNANLIIADYGDPLDAQSAIRQPAGKMSRITVDCAPQHQFITDGEEAGNGRVVLRRGVAGSQGRGVGRHNDLSILAA